MTLAEIAGPQREHLPIGALLVRAGLLTPPEVEQVLLQQQQLGLRFGEVAVKLGLVSLADVEFALAQQFEYSYLQRDQGMRTVTDQVPAAYEPFSAEVEQLRTVRSNLMLNWFDKTRHQNMLAVVGVTPQEGRSYLAANLAVVFSQAGQNTLLIDANLRAPNLHNLFGLRNKVGLSTVLAGHAHDEPIIRISELSGLFVLPGGPVPPNPLELLSRPSFAEVLSRVQHNFDCVIIDTPAMTGSDDAALIAVRVGTALAVACSHRSDFGAFKRMTQGLMDSGVSIVGSVLNDLPETQPKSKWWKRSPKHSGSAVGGS